MKRIISILIILSIFIIKNPCISALVELAGEGITDEKLVEIISEYEEIIQEHGALSLSDNQISDLTPLNKLTKVWVFFLNDNQISDLTPLKNLTNLHMLFLHDNQISDLSPLYDLKNLQILTLNNNPIDESHIIELKSHLPNCKISYTPTPGHVLGNIDVTIFDGIEILKYLVGIESVIDDSKVALEAAMLTAESKARGEPTIFDFVEILLILVGM